MDRDSQQGSRGAPPPVTPSGAPGSNDFAGRAASLQQDLARDLELLRDESWENAAGRQWLDPPPAAPNGLRPGIVGSDRGAASGLDPRLGRGDESPGGGLRGLEGQTGGIGSRSIDAEGVESRGYPSSFAFREEVAEAGGSGGRLVGDGQQAARGLRPQSNWRSSADMGNPAISQDLPAEGPGLVGDGGIPHDGGRTLSRLQGELRQAREELRELQARTSPPVAAGAPTDPASRRLDQRALELRERVKRAQQALDERARKLREALNQERERLKAFHAQLQKKAKQLSEASREQQQFVGGEYAKRKNELETERAELERRAKNLQTLEEEMRTNARVELARRRSQFEESARARMAELQREIDARKSEMKVREAALGEREANVESAVKARLVDLQREQDIRQAEYEAKQRALFEREGQLARQFEARLIESERETANRKAELDARQKILAEHETKLAEIEAGRRSEMERRAAGLQGEFEVRLRALDEREAHLQDAVNARLNEVKRDAAARQAEFEAKEQALRDREAGLREAVNARLSEVKRELEEKEAEHQARFEELRQREADLEQFERVRRVEIEDELSRKRAELEEKQRGVVAAEAELKGQRDALERQRALNEAEYRAKATEYAEMARVYSERQQAEAGLAARHAEVDRREEEVGRIKATFESRERLLQEWQGRLENNETRLEAARLELEQKKQAAIDAEREHRDFLAKVDAQRSVLRSEQEQVKHREDLLKSRQDELEKRETALRRRTEEIESLNRKLDEESERLARERDKFAELEPRWEELERMREGLAGRAGDLARKEESLRHREEALSDRHEKIEQARAETRRVSDLLEARTRDLEGREETIAERIRRAEQAEKEADEAHTVMQREQIRFRELEIAHGEKMAELETTYGSQMSELDERRQVLIREQAAVDETKSAIERQRQELGEQLTTIRTEQTAVRREKQALSEERLEWERTSRELEEKIDLFAKQKEEMADRKRLLEAEWAKMERDRIALRDRERVIGEQRSRLEAAPRELEAQRLELAKHAEETEGLRRQLMEKAERLRQRKARLSEDAATVDTRLRQLNDETAALRQEREQLSDERQRLSEMIKQASGDRESLERERTEFEQVRRNQQGRLEEYERQMSKVSEREARLTDHASQLEAFGVRLKQEYAELQRQRKELAEIQGHGDSGETLAVLLQQIEEREQTVRQRENGLRSQEKSVASSAADLSAEQDELRRRQRELEDRNRELEYEVRAMERQRREIAALAESQKAEIAQQRRLAEKEIAAERTKLAQRDRELEKAVAAQREAADEAAEHPAGDGETEIRSRIDAEFAEKMARLEQREKEIEAQCAARLADVERDIEQRLTQMQDELRAERERVDSEITQRRESVEREIREERARIERENADRFRTPAIASARGGESPVAFAPGDHPGVIPFAEECAVVGEIPDAGDERVWLDEAIAHEPTNGEDSSELGEADLEMVSADGGHPTAATGDEPQPESIPPPVRRFRLLRGVAVLLAAVCVGGGVAGAYLWSPAHTIQTRGLVRLQSLATSGRTIQDHAAAMVSPSVFEAATKSSGVDLRALYRDQQIHVSESKTGDAIELTARSAPGDADAARKWLGAIAGAYETILAKSSDSPEQIRQSVSRIEAELNTKSGELATARAAEESTLNEIRRLEDLGDPKAARSRKQKLKRDVAEALSELEASKTALTQLESAGPPTTPVLPTEDQRQAAYAADEQLSQAIAEQASQAVAFQGVVLGAMEQSAGPMRLQIAAIEKYIGEINRQIGEPLDKDLRQELEQVATQLRAYLAQARAFDKSWNELLPRVREWKIGGDPELPLEYQQEAEKLVRTFHGDSRAAFDEAAKKVEALDRAGSEMTRRRVVKTALWSHVLAGLEARNAWTLAARAVAPKYNVELKALRAGVRDLTPRINEGRDRHLKQLTAHLTKARADEAAAELQQTRDLVETTLRRHQQLSDQFLKADAVATAGEQTAAAILDHKRKAGEVRQRVVSLESSLASLREELRRSRAKVVGASAGGIRYDPLPAGRASMWDLGKSREAALLGGGVAAVFLIGVWLIPRPSAPGRGANP